MDTETSRGDSTGDGLMCEATPTHQDTGKDNVSDEDSRQVDLDMPDPATDSSQVGQLSDSFRYFACVIAVFFFA